MAEKILFVDDEDFILKALARLFRESEYEVYVAKDGEKALRIFAEQKIDVVISDMIMPSMSGYELLSRIRADYPDATRIVLSGYSKEQAVFRSLLDGTAKMYLMKKTSIFESWPVLPQIYREIYR